MFNPCLPTKKKKLGIIKYMNHKKTCDLDSLKSKPSQGREGKGREKEGAGRKEKGGGRKEMRRREGRFLMLTASFIKEIQGKAIRKSEITPIPAYFDLPVIILFLCLDKEGKKRGKERMEKGRLMYPSSPLPTTACLFQSSRPALQFQVFPDPYTSSTPPVPLNTFPTSISLHSLIPCPTCQSNISTCLP